MSTLSSRVQISTDSIVKAGDGQVSADMIGEAVILDFESGMYYGLNSVGARIWELIQIPRQVAAVRDAILDEYDVQPAQCEQDVINLLHDMAGKGLVEIECSPQA